jgi:hypothetical protein
MTFLRRTLPFLSPEISQIVSIERGGYSADGPAPLLPSPLMGRGEGGEH